MLIFLRHFACIACRAHAVQVWGNRQQYEASGSKIVFIGNGAATYIEKFKDDLQLADATILTDPTLRAFLIAGFKRGFLVSHGARSVRNGIVLMGQGHKQKMPGGGAGDIWQLGGVLVVRPDGRVSYQYISEALGDFPPEKDEVEPVAEVSSVPGEPEQPTKPTAE